MTNWSELEDAYGAATEVPNQLAALASTSEEERNLAYKFCYSNLFHQGSRYSASVAAIPTLFRLALTQDTPDRGDLIQLLLHLAVGYPSYYLTGEFGLANPITTNDHESPDEGQCYTAVKSRVDDLRRLLMDNDAAVRMNAAHALAYFRPANEWTLERLASLVSTEDNSDLRATAAISLGALTGSVSKPESQTRSVLLLQSLADKEDEQSIVQFGASIGLAYLLQGKFTADSTRILIAQLNRLPIQTELPWMNGDIQRLAASIYESLAAQGNTVAFEALEAMVANASGENAKWLCSYLFSLVFPSRVTDNTVLNKKQMNALKIALANSALWREGVTNGKPCLWAPPILKELGVGRTKQDIERRLKTNS